MNVWRNINVAVWEKTDLAAGRITPVIEVPVSAPGARYFDLRLYKPVSDEVWGVLGGLQDESKAGVSDELRP